MKTTGRATRLTVFVDETEVWHGRPLYTEIVRRAHAAGIAGATALRAVEGYGSGGRLHTWRLLSLSQQLPIVIIVIDTAARIEAFLGELDGVIDDGLITVDTVDVIHYERDPDPSS